MMEGENCHRGKGGDIVVGAEEICAGGVVYRVCHVHRRRKVYIARPDQVHAMDVQIRDSGGEAIDDLSFEVEASLLHPRRAEIGRECRNITGKKACQVPGWCACGRGQSATYRRIGIRREDLARVELGIIEVVNPNCCCRSLGLGSEPRSKDAGRALKALSRIK